MPRHKARPTDTGETHDHSELNIQLVEKHQQTTHFLLCPAAHPRCRQDRNWPLSLFLLLLGWWTPPSLAHAGIIQKQEAAQSGPYPEVLLSMFPEATFAALLRFSTWTQSLHWSWDLLGQISTPLLTAQSDTCRPQ